MLLSIFVCIFCLLISIWFRFVNHFNVLWISFSVCVCEERESPDFNRSIRLAFKLNLTNVIWMMERISILEYWRDCGSIANENIPTHIHSHMHIFILHRYHSLYQHESNSPFLHVCAIQRTTAVASILAKRNENEYLICEIIPNEAIYWRLSVGNNEPKWNKSIHNKYEQYSTMDQEIQEKKHWM